MHSFLPAFISESSIINFHKDNLNYKHVKTNIRTISNVKHIFYCFSLNRISQCLCFLFLDLSPAPPHTLVKSLEPASQWLIPLALVKQSFSNLLLLLFRSRVFSDIAHTQSEPELNILVSLWECPSEYSKYL